MKKSDVGNAFIVPVLSFMILLALSFVSWSELSNKTINDFSLFEDLMSEKISVHTTELVDPLLAEAIMEDSTLDGSAVETEDSQIETLKLQSDTREQHVKDITDSSDYEPKAIVKAFVPDRVDGIIPIEDYTLDGKGLSRFARALANRTSGVARIAVIGDSYIEGDILTQDIRQLLQSEYGGRGVGYMSMHSDFPGFRRSVVQSDANWKVVDMRNVKRDSIKTLSGEYCVANAGSRVSFKGAKGENVKSWGSSKLLFIAPEAGIITVTAGGVTQDMDVAASPDVQCISIDGETSEFSVRTDISGLKVLGAWLEDTGGVGVDCMSLRGNSGITHRQISIPLARSMSEYVPYSLIIVEYGMNALSSEQTDYSSYSQLMSKVIRRLKEAFPEADILMLGVGDRGQKSGSEVTSLPTTDALTNAQRDCARREGIMFWDTRAAMGGINSIVDWRHRGLVNADYIHLNHKGGAVLAQEFVNALKRKVDEY